MTKNHARNASTSNTTSNTLSTGNSRTIRIAIELAFYLAAISAALILAGINYSLLLPAIGIPLVAVLFYGGLWHSTKKINVVDRELAVLRNMTVFVYGRHAEAGLIADAAATSRSQSQEDLPKLSWREARAILKNSDRTAEEQFAELQQILA